MYKHTLLHWSCSHNQYANYGKCSSNYSYNYLNAKCSIIIIIKISESASYVNVAQSFIAIKQ